MTNRFFEVSLTRTGNDKRETAPARVRLRVIATPNADQTYLVSVPTTAASVTTAPTAAQCHLQLWEVDFFRVDRWLSTEETDRNARRNRLLATIPGVVIVDGGSHRFVATAAPTLLHTLRERDGFATLELDRAGTTTPMSTQVPLGEYEGVVELAAALALDPQSNALATHSKATPFQVHNVKATILRQVQERGGIAVSFVADYSSKFPNANEEEFEKQAESNIPTEPTLKVEGGELVFGYHAIADYAEMPAIMDAVADKARTVAGLATKPRVALLPIYSHGLRNALKINVAGYGSNGSPRYRRSGSSNVADFVTRVLPHLADGVVIPVYACSAGAGPTPNPDNTMGNHFPGEELGGDSLGWALFRELRRQGIQHPTVWAHLSAAHTTRNPMLRVFSAAGSADFPNLLFGMRRVTADTVRAYMRVFRRAGTPEQRKQILGRQNLIRAMCLHSALYLPWDFHGGAHATMPSHSLDAAANAMQVFGDLRALLQSPVAVDDGFVLDARQTQIELLPAPVVDDQVSEHFAYSDYAALMTRPGPLPLALARMTQLLRYRFDANLKLFDLEQSVIGEARAATLQPTPNAAAARTRLLTRAQEMVSEGLLASADMVGATGVRIRHAAS